MGLPTSSSPIDRKLVFVSHANPEQNDFARWLSAHLANAGYEVWSDVTKLIGGEIFWDNIEEAIRNHAAKVLIAVSKAANTKDGVLDEVNLAITIERKHNIPQFVVPLRVDDLDFADFRANVSRKIAIDFSESWADGLAAVLKVLERDGVPRGSVTPADVAKLCAEKLDQTLKPREGTETLLTNWLTLESFPPEISIIDLGVDTEKVREIMAATTLPWFPYHRLIGTFGTEGDLRADLPPQLEISRKYLVPLDAFLKGKPPELPGMDFREARNHITSLIRQSWDRTMRARGMTAFEMASGGIAWYFTKGQIEDDKVHFVDHKGKRRFKKVVGRSDKRNVYWHLGFQAKAKMVDGGHLILKPAIIFSQDGKSPLASSTRMHRLRRGFCRSWWNPQWRDLMLAFISWLAKGNPTIELDAGMAGPIVLSASPFALEIPVVFNDPTIKTSSTGEPAEPDEEAEAPPDAPIEEDEEWDEYESGDDSVLNDEESLP